MLEVKQQINNYDQNIYFFTESSSHCIRIIWAEHCMSSYDTSTDLKCVDVSECKC